jgi:hypothetical protein
MAGENEFPRRKRAGRGRNAPDPQGAATRLTDDPSSRVSAPEAFDVARYVTDMTAQLEAMAIAAHLDLLAYFLGMAKAEGDLFLRSNVQGDDAPAEAPDEPKPDSGDAFG